jgi:hypothetical protein
MSLLKTNPKVSPIPAGDIQDTDKGYFPSHLQILMEATRGHTVKHLVVQQKPTLSRADLERVFYHLDTDVLFHIVGLVRRIGNDFSRTTCVLKEI